jgi:hypothetical protein
MMQVCTGQWKNEDREKSSVVHVVGLFPEFLKLHVLPVPKQRDTG